MRALDVLEEGGLEGGDPGGVHLVQEPAHAAVDDGNLGACYTDWTR